MHCFIFKYVRNFPAIFLLLIFHFIPLCSGNSHCMISVILNLLMGILWHKMWSIWVNVPNEIEKKMEEVVYCCQLHPVSWWCYWLLKPVEVQECYWMHLIHQPFDSLWLYEYSILVSELPCKASEIYPLPRFGVSDFYRWAWSGNKKQSENIVLTRKYQRKWMGIIPSAVLDIT